jgi:dolichyl-phosphate-mannose--protein O-mannosyl transferase
MKLLGAVSQQVRPRRLCVVCVDVVLCVVVFFLLLPVTEGIPSKLGIEFRDYLDRSQSY